MSIIKEFKEFAIHGNAVDMAVGIIIGAAFGKIVSSLVSDVIMPPVGALMGGVDFSHLAITIKQATATAPAVTIKYGAFINTIIDFTIVAFAVFILIKGVNALKKKEAAAEKIAPTPPIEKEELLLTEIRDLLRNKN